MDKPSAQYYLETLEVGPLQVNCYLLGCEKTRAAVVIDPAGDAPIILATIERRRALVTAILLTHGHYDHLGAVSEIKAYCHAPIMIHRLDAECLTNPMINLSALTGDNLVCPPADRLLEEGDTVAFGEFNLKVLYTPGHTRGSASFVFDQSVFGGDLLFYGSIGRTDLPGGSFDEIERSIVRKIYTLPDDYIVYPGHGEPTTVGFERKHNAFVRHSA